jgi:cytosine/creatinine deaminase
MRLPHDRKKHLPKIGARVFQSLFERGTYRIVNARVPLELAPQLTKGRVVGELAECELVVEDGTLSSLRPAQNSSPAEGLPAIDLDHGIVLPRFVDVHTHLDRGHIWPRSPNLDGASRHSAAFGCSTGN